MSFGPVCACGCVGVYVGWSQKGTCRLCCVAVTKLKRLGKALCCPRVASVGLRSSERLGKNYELMLYRPPRATAERRLHEIIAFIRFRVSFAILTTVVYSAESHSHGE